MTFYFSWSRANEPFDPKRHTREDLKIFSLVIEGQEGAFPLARLKVQNKKIGLGHNPFQQTAYLSFRDSRGVNRLLFKGRLCHVPEKIEGETYEIHLTAEPLNSGEALHKLCSELKKTSCWDSLFVPKDHQDNPSDVLEALDSLFYWSRTDQSVTLSNLFRGRHHLDINTSFLRDSLTMKMVDLPLKGVRVRLKSSWTQQFRGTADLSFFIRYKFPGGFINTLSGPDLESKWWQEGNRLGQSGYWIEETHLREMRAPYTGALNIYPSQSRKIWVSPDDPAVRGKDTPFQIRLKRFWYRSCLVLGWRYRQKRQEAVEFYLGHQVQPLGPSMEKVRTLNFTLHDLDLADITHQWRPHFLYARGDRILYQNHLYEAQENHRSQEEFNQNQEDWLCLGPKPDIPFKRSRSSFFTSARGHQCVAHALDRARAHLAASSRAVEIRFSTDFERVCDVTCDHSVTLRDDRLPGGTVTGKVKSYRLVAQGGKGRLRGDIVLACSVGVTQLKTPQNQEEEEQEQFASADYCEDFKKVVQPLTSPQGIHFLPFYHQKPTRGLCNPERFTAYDLVEDVRILNGPEEQNDYLQENQYPYRHNINGALKEVPTDLQLRLRDLRSYPLACHHIHVTIPDGWSAPCQINLSAPHQERIL